MAVRRNPARPGARPTSPSPVRTRPAPHLREELDDVDDDEEREEDLDEERADEDPDEDLDDEEREADSDDERADDVEEDVEEDPDEERVDDVDEEEEREEDLEDDEAREEEEEAEDDEGDEEERSAPPRRRRARPPQEIVHRRMTLRVVPARRGQRAAAADNDEPIEIALSSETAVERYDYWLGGRYFEVLDHSASAVDLSRAADGLPFLLDHDTREQVGIIEGLRVDGDRVLRGRVRFSRSAKAQEIRQDMLDGIRKWISVGYRISSQVLDEMDEDRGDTYRATRWTPMEGSGVAVPADINVGVGRSLERGRRDRVPGRRLQDRARGGARHPNPRSHHTAPKGQETRMKTKERAARPGAAPNTGVNVGTVQVRDRVGGQNPEQRADAILALAQEFNVNVTEARQWIGDGRSVSWVRGELLNRFRTGQLSVTPPNPGAALTLTDKEERRYSMLRAINALITGNRDAAGFEFEVSDEISKQTGKSTRGILVPTTLRANMPGALTAADALKRARETGVGAEIAMRSGMGTRSGLAVGTATAGAETKFTEFGSFIDLLRSRTTLLEMGAQMLTGLQGDIGFVEQTGSGTFSWGTETANAAVSQLSTGLRTMAPKVGQSASTYTRQLLAQSVVDVENLIRLDIAALHARGIDFAGIAGPGTGNAPKGVLSTTGIGSVVGGANGLQPTYEHAIDLQKEIAIDNAWVGSINYLTTPQIAARFMKTQEFTGTNGKACWTGNIFDGQLAGLPGRTSTQVPSDLTKGTSEEVCHALILGCWDQIIIGEWGAMEIIVDPYTVGPALVKLMSIQMIDVFVRYAAAFAAMKDALQ